MRQIILATLLFAGPSAASAQWRLSLRGGSAASHGDSRDDSDPARPEFHADHPTTLTVALDRDTGRWRASIEARHTTADLSEVSRSVAVTTFGAFEAWGAGVELAIRVAGRAPGPALHAGVGLGGDHWRLDGAASRWRATARASVESDLPLARAWSAVLRAEATAGPSVFTAEELPEGFAQRTTWRTGIELGVARRLQKSKK